jgi:hypothetical protein
MLVALFNVVKVESVPLKSMFLARTARRRYARAIIGDRGLMPINASPGLLVAGVVAAALPIAAVLIVLSPGSTSTSTAEDQVRAVLNGMNGSYNRSDFAAFASHVCEDMLRADGYKAGWYKSRESDGPTHITVNSVDVTGGPHPQAVANVRFVAANHNDAKTLDIDFLREGADWKACRYHAGRSV